MPKKTLTPLLLKYGEAAELLNISTSTLYEMVRNGKIPVVQFGNGVKTGLGCTRFRLKDLENFIMAHRR